jgi:uroporphyrinogen decarboxylase
MVAAKVKELRTYFPTGLIVSPSHEGLQPDVPPVNIKALFGEATKIYE